MAAPLAGNLEVQARIPLDNKYWVNSKTNLDDGLIYDGLFRFTKDKQELYLRVNSIWTIVSIAKVFIIDEIAPGSPAGDLITQLKWLATQISSISKLVPRITISQTAAIDLINNKKVVVGQPYKISISTGFLNIDGGTDSSNFAKFGELTYTSSGTTILVKADVKTGSYVEYSSGNSTPSVVVEHNLTSNSDDNVPSVKAVNDGINSAIASIPSPATFTLTLLPEYTCTSNGTQLINLPTGTIGVVDLVVLEVTSNTVRTIYPTSYSISNGKLQVTASLVSGDKLVGYYYTTNATGNGSSGGSSLARIPEFTVSNDGQQTITLPTGAKDVANVQVLEYSTSLVRTIYLTACSVTNSILTISADASLKAGDKITGSFYK